MVARSGGSRAALVAVACSGCASFGSGSPPPALEGAVVDLATGLAVADALLILDDGTRAWTDGRGEYAVPELAPGRHRVLVVAPGCRSAEGEVALEAGSVGSVEIGVALPEPQAIAGEVPPPEESRGRVVTAREIAEMGEVRTSEVVRRAAPEMVGAATGDPGRPAALRGRGSRTPSGPRVPVLVVDGIVVHAVNASALDEIAVRDVAWIEILSGAVAGWEYGTAGAGGVIRVQTKRGYLRDRDLAPDVCPLPDGWADVGA